MIRLRQSKGQRGRRQHRRHAIQISRRAKAISCVFRIAGSLSTGTRTRLGRLGVLTLCRKNQAGAEQRIQHLGVSVDTTINAAVSSANHRGAVPKDLVERWIAELRIPARRDARTDRTVVGIVGILTPAGNVLHQRKANLRVINLAHGCGILTCGQVVLHPDRVAAHIGKHHLAAVPLRGRHLDCVADAVVHGNTWLKVPGVGDIQIVVRNSSTRADSCLRSIKRKSATYIGIGVGYLGIRDQAVVSVKLAGIGSRAGANSLEPRSSVVDITAAAGIPNLISRRVVDAGTIVSALVVVEVMLKLPSKLDEVIALQLGKIVTEEIILAVPDPGTNLLSVDVIRRNRIRLSRSCALAKRLDRTRRTRNLRRSACALPLPVIASKAVVKIVRQ